MTLSLIGRRIGNYDIQAKIGEGGMGMVYLGLHPQIGKRVAIKVLHEELSSKAEVVVRFFNEARSVNDINHPNIVDIVDFGDINLDGVVFKYIIMEFLDGESLSSRIRREGVTIRETLHIIAQCASALAASHSKGVVHRDLKPENVFLCTRGPDRNYVKLLDFGIAKLIGDGGAAMSSRTRTGMVIGTPAYMSPEQCEGRGLIDHRSDIYALGVVMYELLTGRVPFPGDGFGEVLVAHLTREPEPPAQLNHNIPPEIEAIVLHCLKKDKGQRFQSMTDMLAALQDPAAHYQIWAHSAQLPAGAMAANAMMSTVLSVGGASPLQSGAMPAWGQPAGPPMSPMSVGGAPNMSGLVPMPPAHVSHVSGAMPHVSGAMQAMPVGGGTLALMPDTPVVSGQPRSPTGMVQRPAGMASESMPAVPVMGGQGPRPTTLSGTSGESANPGRRPAGVLLGFAGAIALGALAAVGVKAMGSPPANNGKVTQAPDKDKERVQVPVTPPPRPQAPEMVALQITSDPPGAAVFHKDRPEEAGKTPLSLKVKKGTAVSLVFRLDGYEEASQSLTADQDQPVSVTLSKPEPTPVSKEEGKKIRKRRDKDKDGSSSSRRRRKDKGDSNELLKPIF
jgi:serine/threonine-protein kinase